MSFWIPLLAVGVPEVAACCLPLRRRTGRSYFSRRLGKHIAQRRVDRQRQRRELLEDLVERRHVGQVGQRLHGRIGWLALGERTDVGGVVERLDVLTGAGDGHRIEQLEEVKVQTGKDRVGGALLGGQL